MVASNRPTSKPLLTRDFVHEVVESIGIAHMTVATRRLTRGGAMEMKKPIGFTIVQSKYPDRNSDAAAEMVRQAISKQTVLVFSLSEGKQGFIERLICKQAGVPLRQIRNGYFPRTKWRNLTNAAAEISEAPLYLIDSRERFSGALATSLSRRLILDLRAKGKQLGLIIVDGLKIRVLQEGQASLRALESASRTLKVPIVAFAN